MSFGAYLRIALLLPVGVGVLSFLLLLMTGLDVSENPLSLTALGLVLGAIPQLFYWAGVRWWSLGRSDAELQRYYWQLPVFYLLLTLPVPFIFGEPGGLVQGLALFLMLSPFAFVYAYGYALLIYGGWGLVERLYPRDSADGAAPDASPPVRFPRYAITLIGVVYGLVARLLFEWLEPFGLGLVSLSFFFAAPFVVGYLRVRLELSEGNDVSFGRAVLISWQPILVFLAVTFISFMEGFICLIMALPLFMLLSAFGAMVARVFRRLRHGRSTTSAVLLLPLLLAPLERALPPAAAVYEVGNSIVIDAPAERVWRELGNVDAIGAEELRLGVTRLIGVPRPLRAEMDAAGVGAVRTSVWDKGVVFREVITAWEENRLMAYDFAIDPDLIPDTALDRHVKLGGEYFSPLRGRYELRALDAGTTQLTLATVVEDNTRFGPYSRLWGRIIFSDFHDSLLLMLKHRSEQGLTMGRAP